MKLAVVGSRGFNDYELLKHKLNVIHEKRGIILIVSGGAIGADSLSEKWALENNVPTKILYPDWNKHGKKAGYIRNVEIVQNSDALIAFWDGVSKGTEHSINLARAQGIPVSIIRYNETHN
jgi:hypothetical protein